MSRLHLANDKMYDFLDKPASRTTVSRCKSLARHKPRLGMHKEADPSDMALQKGLDFNTLALDVFHHSDLLRLV